MIKSFFSFMFSVVLLFNILSASLIQLNFSMNRDWISQTFCVKKNIPNNSCEGKCYLSKKLKDNKEKKTEQNPVESQQKQINLFTTAILVCCKEQNWFLKRNYLKSYVKNEVQKGFVFRVKFPPDDCFLIS